MSVKCLLNLFVLLEYISDVSSGIRLAYLALICFVGKKTIFSKFVILLAKYQNERLQRICKKKCLMIIIARANTSLRGP